jgi:hypothetical protein
MRIKSIVVHVLVLLMAAPSVMAQQRRDSPDVWRAFAERLEVGSYVTVRLQHGPKLKGHIIQVAGDTLRIQPKTRLPVPLREVPFAEIESIERQRETLSPGAKVLVGLGVGSAAILGTLFVIFATWYD